MITVTKVKILNRGDCCGERLKGAKIFIGDNLVSTLRNPEQGKWSTVSCKVSGEFIKIQAAPKKYLHFCGLKVFAIPYEQPEPEPEEIPEPIPEPPKPEPICSKGIEDDEPDKIEPQFIDPTNP